MTCWKCNGDGWLRVFNVVPAFVYGETRQVAAARICPVCNGNRKIKLKPPTEGNQ